MFVTLPAQTTSRACVLPWRLSRCATAAALRVLSRHLPPARVAWRTPRTDGKCASTLRLADARVSAARGPCRQACQCRTRPHRCGLPAAAGCRPAAAGGRLSVTGSALVASQVPAGRAATRRVRRAAQRPPGAPAAATMCSSRRRRGVATWRRVWPRGVPGGGTWAAAACATAAGAPARRARAGRIPPATRRSGRTSCMCCTCRALYVCVLQPAWATDAV